MAIAERGSPRLADRDPLLPKAFGEAVLRRLRPGDLRAFQAYRRMPELARYQGWSPMTDAEALAFLGEMEVAPLFRPGEWIQLGIAAAATDALIGDIGVHISADSRSAEVGFTLVPVAQGRGIATAAVREAVRLVFALTPVSGMEGVTDARNVRSVRLLERLGFTFREAREVVFRGEACTEQVFALARAGFAPPR